MKYFLIIFVITILVVATSLYFNKTKESKPKKYRTGVIRVVLKTNSKDESLREFISLYRELSVKFYRPSSFYTIVSLKPYIEWQKKTKIKAINNLQVQESIRKGDYQLLSIFNELQKNSVLLESNFHESQYLYSNPHFNVFATIYIKFNDDTSILERERFFQQYPQLEIVKDHKESNLYDIGVPEGKEQYWIDQFLKQDFVENASHTSPAVLL